MTDSPEQAAETQAGVRRRRRISSVWIVPIVAFLLAGWLVWKNHVDQGPLATITFETAEGLATGKTEVRCRSVKVGLVEEILLTRALDGVEVNVRLEPKYADLLAADSRFWVVRPRVSTSNVSGLGTLITGAYIELDPGDSDAEASRFDGLEEPPVTGSSVPGLRLTLSTEDAGSLTVGAPIYYHGFEVGTVERRSLDPATDEIRFEVFIEARFAELVRERSLFWNTSGIDVTAGADGFKLRTPSVQAIVTGGAAFTTPEDDTDSPPAENGDVFTLFADESAALDSNFRPDRRALLFFDQSVRGLERGAPVEFRGIPLGRVVEISLRHSPPGDSRIPVLVEIDSSAFSRIAEMPAQAGLDLAQAVDLGLRARLGTGSLLTGALFVDLDIFAEAEPAELGEIDGYDVIPTRSSGLVQLEAKLNSILAKIDSLALDETLAKFGNAADETAATLAASRKSLDQLEATLGEVRDYLAADSTQALPQELTATLTQLRESVDSLGPGGPVQGDLRRTLDELRASLRSITALSDTIEEKPNSLIFGRKPSADPIPRAR